MDFPKISVILPNYNGGKYLTKAIQSFIDQDYPSDRKELIIVDGKSNDCSHQIIESFTNKHSNIIWINEIDNGISHASNIGIKYSTGEIISKLGSDDLLYKDILKEVGYAASWCNFDIVFFNGYANYVNENKCIYWRCPQIQINAEVLLKYGAQFSGEDIFFKKKIFIKYKFDENNKYSMDYELSLNLCQENYLWLYIDKAATIHHMDNNITSKITEKQFIEACIVSKKYAKKYNYEGFRYFSENNGNQNNTKHAFLITIKKYAKTIIKKIIN